MWPRRDVSSGHRASLGRGAMEAGLAASVSLGSGMRFVPGSDSRSGSIARPRRGRVSCLRPERQSCPFGVLAFRFWDTSSLDPLHREFPASTLLGTSRCKRRRRQCAGTRPLFSVTPSLRGYWGHQEPSSSTVGASLASRGETGSLPNQALQRTRFASLHSPLNASR